MELVILTPRRELLRTEAAYVETYTSKGGIGILPHHAPLASPLGESVLLSARDQAGNWLHYAIHRGFLEVLPQRVTVLAEAGEAAQDIDVARSERARKRAERRLVQQQERIDHIRAESALQRARNRLSAAERN